MTVSRIILRLKHAGGKHNVNKQHTRRNIYSLMVNSLCLSHEGIQGSRSIAPLIRNHDTKWR